MAQLVHQKLSPEGRTLLVTCAVLTLLYLVFNREYYLAWLLPAAVMRALDTFHMCWLYAVYPQSNLGVVVRLVLGFMAWKYGLPQVRRGQAVIKGWQERSLQAHLAQANAPRVSATRDVVQGQQDQISSVLTEQKQQEELERARKAAEARRERQAQEEAMRVAEEQRKAEIKAKQAALAKAAADKQAEAERAAAQRRTAAAAQGAAQASSTEQQRLRVIEQKQAELDAIAAAMQQAKAAEASQQQASSSSSGAGSTMKRATSGASISRQEAEAAEQRQREYMAQLAAEASAPPPEVLAARRVREEQDAEYARMLAEDEAKAAACEAAQRAEEEARAAAAAAEEAAKQAAEAAARRAEEGRKALRDSLPAEPSSEEAGVVLIRVRLPNGSSHIRRFPGACTVQQVCDWVQSMDAMPWIEQQQEGGNGQQGKASWSLMNIYPRQALQPEALVSEVAVGASQVALFVELP